MYLQEEEEEEEGGGDEEEEEREEEEKHMLVGCDVSAEEVHEENRGEPHRSTSRLCLLLDEHQYTDAARVL